MRRASVFVLLLTVCAPSFVKRSARRDATATPAVILLMNWLSSGACDVIDQSSSIRWRHASKRIARAWHNLLLVVGDL